MDWCQCEVCIQSLSRLACRRHPNSGVNGLSATISGPPFTKTSDSLVMTPYLSTEFRGLGKVSPEYAIGERRRMLNCATLKISVVVVWIFIQFLGEHLDVGQR
jgi:hypothetical protein